LFDGTSRSTDLDRSPVDLARLVQESVGDLREVVMSGHPVTVNVDDTPTISADPTAAREIVCNLLSNASKYSDEDAPIDVTVRVVGPAAEVIVRNHGSG
jgi:two-component system, OmpR family, sensor histidine kinase KdpD